MMFVVVKQTSTIGRLSESYMFFIQCSTAIREVSSVPEALLNFLPIILCKGGHIVLYKCLLVQITSHTFGTIRLTVQGDNQKRPPSV